MYALLALLVVAGVSMLAVRVGAVALRMTGLSEEVARFQARSAFTGVGFTTDESEQVIAYPARRDVVRALMFAGNVGTVTAISSLVLSFVGGRASPLRLGVVVGAALALFALARSERFDRLLTPIIERALSRHADYRLRDYSSLLHLHRDYRVAEITVGADDWLASASLSDLDLTAEGVVVLGIRRRDGTYVGAPPPDEEITPGDTLVAYGRGDRLRELSERAADDVSAHEDAKDDHRRLRDRERRLDPERGSEPVEA